MGKDKGATVSLAQAMGIIFIFLGIIGFIVILMTFDFKEYNLIKDYPATHEAELMIMQKELINTWILASVTLIGNIAIATVLITLDKIAKLLTDIRDKTSA